MPSSTKKRPRVLLVDDHPVTRTGLRMTLEAEGDFEVCGEASNASRGFSAALELEPDLVITDVSMPGRSGFELVRDLAASSPRTPVLVVSMHSENSCARRALEAGARGYIMKTEPGDRIRRAARAVLAGRIHVSRRISDQLLESVSGRNTSKRSGIDALSAREFEVFKLLGSGASTREIASQLHLSPKTIDTHRAHIKQKLGAKGFTELIALSADWMARQAASNDAR
jgi:DNA-binding NarL/FixJ family response regulator